MVAAEEVVLFHVKTRYLHIGSDLLLHAIAFDQEPLSKGHVFLLLLGFGLEVISQALGRRVITVSFLDLIAFLKVRINQDVFLLFDVVGHVLRVGAGVLLVREHAVFNL